MKYEITYSCGHNGTVALFGSGSERERAIYGYRNYKVCPECEDAKKQAQKIAEQAQTENMGLVALTGSDKQIAWANNLRIGYINMCKVKEEYKAGFIAWVNTKTDARFWIDCKTEKGIYCKNQFSAAFGSEIQAFMNV